MKNTFLFENVRYKTHKSHTWGDKTYKAGTECFVSRKDPYTLFVKFDDGVVMTLGANYYAAGIEQPRYISWVEQMRLEIDEQIFAELDNIINDKNFYKPQ